MRWGSHYPHGSLSWALATNTTTEALAGVLRAVPEAEWTGCCRLLLLVLRGQGGPQADISGSVATRPPGTPEAGRAERAALEAEAERRAP